jgi:flavin reductase (DIM6/NTAB) family NADH-FMN oxidoreductase RutF
MSDKAREIIMKKEQIDVMDYVSEIMKALKKGVLLTAKNGAEVNCMTIAWGQIGIEWNRMIFTAFVRTGRHTHKMLEESGEFSVNIGMGDKVGKILGFCGTKSGADVNKVSELGLTLVPGTDISTPGIKELPLTLECKVIYKQLQEKNEIPADINTDNYPQDVPSSDCGSNRDYHTMFFGEIVGAYIVE